MSFVRELIGHYRDGSWLRFEPSNWYMQFTLKRKLRKLRRMWYEMPPQQQLANFIDILDRSAAMRQAFVAALRLRRQGLRTEKKKEMR